MASDLSELWGINNEFLMFLAHGERPQTKLDDRNSKHDDYFTIDNSDNNIYLTFSDIGTSLYQLPINIILTSLSSSYTKNLFKTILNRNILSASKYDENQILLKGLIYNAFVENLLNIIKTEKTITENIYGDWDNYDYKENIMNSTLIDLMEIDYKIKFETNTFADVKISGNESLQKYYDSLITSLKINDFITSIKNRETPSDLLFIKLLFGEKIPDFNTIQCILCIYKLIILNICSMMKELEDLTMYTDNTFYYILSQNFIKDFLLNNKNTSFIKVLSKFEPIYNRYLIEKYKIVLKMYYKNKSTPNFNYYINGYFLESTQHIVQVGLHKLVDYIKYVKNSIYNPEFLEDQKFSKEIIPLNKKCFAKNKNYIDDKKRPVGQTFSITNDTEALDYINNNWNFMIRKSLYPGLRPREFEPKVYTDSFGEERIEFTKGLIRTLETLITKRRIFGNDNIILLFSCASSDEKNVWNLRTARRLSIAEQNKLKYLKYKQKYLALKKYLSNI